MTVSIVYDDAIGDPLVDVLKQNPIKGIESKPLSVFLKDAGFSFDNESLTLKVENLKVKSSRIIDRVVEITPKAIEAISASNANLLHRGQVFSAYETIIKQTEDLNFSCQYTEMGKLLPLPTQWQIINKHFLDINTPEFRYGYGPEVIDYSDLLNPIFKSPFDLYSWKPNKRKDIKVWDEFVVSRPKGTPVISFKISEGVIVDSLDGTHIMDDIKENIIYKTKIIIKLFEASIGEILWFVEDNNITFCAFSLFLSGAAQSKYFSDEAINFFQSYT
ncbi:MAG: hypothetical protein KBT36_18040 [Kurthia sp.]|uniref:hypothetical protein n=1 Tax=Acinetobacter TaxID=469 RepID=UPI0007D0410D|nr:MULTISPECIES: hypothetical protein [Acinetobacter]MBQ0141167.1 hypothetical protein [Candidatus Kurthia equi]OAL85838.1 hypothetical protein AY605_14675 [Acinetobacter sp. SFD]PJI36522.1 hypothetical protein CU318_03065 [Acinetobacter pseudolwoffii]